MQYFLMSTRGLPGGVNHQRGGRKGHFLPRRHHHPTRQRIATLSQQTTANLAIDTTGHADPRSRAQRQIGKTGKSAGVVVFSKVQQPMTRLTDAFRIAQHFIGLHSPEPGSWQIAPVGASVFGNIPGDIGQLHGNTEIDRERSRSCTACAEYLTHHQADRSGDAVGVADQAVLINDAHLLQVLLQALDEFQGDRDRYAAFIGQVEKIGHDRQGDTLSGELPPNSAQFASRQLRVTAIDEVVEPAAEGVKPRTAPEVFITEQAAGKVETATVTLQNRFRRLISETGI